MAGTGSAVGLIAGVHVFATPSARTVGRLMRLRWPFRDEFWAALAEPASGPY